MHPFVPKNRKPKFDLTLKIIDLNNVPLVSGTSYIKWHLPLSAAAEHRGRTAKCQIRDHKVEYDYEKTVPIRLTVDRNGVLQETDIHFEVVQEYASSSRSDKIALGNIKLNLAEYVDGADDGEEGITRRYLMQDSKINSTLKIAIHMRLVEGDRNYTAPALKSAPVFGGIAGIMAGEQGEADDVGHVPSLSSKSRENHEFQDMYRRNLAAHWTAQPGELKADECIENIFAGGDGWGNPPDAAEREVGSRRTFLPGRHNDGPKTPPKRHQAGPFGKGNDMSPRSRQGEHVRVPSGGSIGGRGSLEQHANDMKAEAANYTYPSMYGVDEFEVREDLKSWRIKAPVS